MATKSMCFCDPCLEKGFTLAISNKSPVNTTGLHWAKLYEACETSRKYVHSTVPEIIMQCRAQMTMG